MTLNRSRREDVLDSVIGLKRPADYLTEEGARFELRWEKSRGLTGDAVKNMEVKLHGDEQGGMVWTWQSLEASSKDRIVEMLADGMVQADIARDLNVSRAWVSKIKRQMDQEAGR